MSIESFLDHAQERGIIFSKDIIQDGQLHRVHLDGDKKGSVNGWYTYYDDVIPVCVYGSWKMGQKFVWSARHESELSTAEKMAIKRKMKDAQREAARLRNLEQQNAAIEVGNIYQSADPSAVSHAYLDKKGVKPNDYLIVAEEGMTIQGTEKEIDISGALLVPVIDSCGQLVSIQYIYPNGRKMFHPKGKLKGCFSVVHGESSKAVYICEGYATAMSVNMATKCTVYVSFNCGNMESVAKAITEHHKDRLVIIAGDDDWQTMSPIKNPGKHHGNFAASSLRISAVYPEFKSDRAIGDTDFNDMHNRYGIESLVNLLPA